MKCPECNSEESAVQHTRSAPNGTTRRRTCLSCNYRYSTIEMLAHHDGVKTVPVRDAQTVLEARKYRRIAKLVQGEVA